jgi:integrase
LELALLKAKKDTTRKELQSTILNKYIEKINKDSTRREFRQRLITFEEFILSKYKSLVDRDFINCRVVSRQSESTDDGQKIYVYDLFWNYVEYLKKKDLSRQRIKMLLHTSRRALNKAMDIKIDKDTFKDETNDSLPDEYSNDKTLITNENIKTLIYACKDLKLRTIITVLGSTGLRVSELLKLKYSYLNLEWTKTENNIDVPPFIFIPAHITKTRKSSRRAYLTAEAVQCLRDWLDYKYRERRGYQKPSDINESYIFRMYNDTPSTPEQVEKMEKDMNLNYRNMYFYLSADFKKLVEKEGLGEKFRNNNHSVSIHSLRHYVVTTVEELTSLTSAYFWVGKKQKGYIFNDRDPKAVLDLYKKVELRLTFLNPKIVKQTESKEIEVLRQQLKRQNKEIQLMKFSKVIDNMIDEERAKKNPSGIFISAEKQLSYFIENLPPRITESDIELIKEMIEDKEITEYQEESEEAEEQTEKFNERYNEYLREGKIDFDPIKDVYSYGFDEKDNLHIEFKKSKNRPNKVLPPLK